MPEKSSEYFAGLDKTPIFALAKGESPKRNAEIAQLVEQFIRNE